MPAYPKAPRRLRMAALLLGAALLVWLPFEDLTPRLALLFSVLICALSAAFLLVRYRKFWLSRSYAGPLLGGLAGMAVAPVAVLLMGMKSGLHAHPAPEYNPEQVLAVLRLAPIWGVIGLLAGLALRMWVVYRSDKP